MSPATFLADAREDLPRVHATTQVLQGTDDPMPPSLSRAPAVRQPISATITLKVEAGVDGSMGEYVYGRSPRSEFVATQASRKLPHLSPPDALIQTMRGVPPMSSDAREIPLARVPEAIDGALDERALQVAALRSRAPRRVWRAEPVA